MINSPYLTEFADEHERQADAELWAEACHSWGRRVMERRRRIVGAAKLAAQRLADIVASYIYLRSKRLDVSFIAHERVTEALRAAGRTLGLARPDDIIFLDWREISLALREGSTPAALCDCADARRNGFEFVAVAGAIEWIPCAVSRQTQEAVRPSTSDDDVVGITACGGRVRGIVRLVLTDQDMLDMIPGEILVTTGTIASLMLAVEKAAGIVTDEGGMLSRRDCQPRVRHSLRNRHRRRDASAADRGHHRHVGWRG
jgi:hypothetical protein